MVGVLGHQHLGQQASGRDALVNDVRGNRRLREGLALGARPFASDMPLHREDAGHIVQLLRHVLANALQLAAAAGRAAGGGIRLMANLAPGQVGWQRGAFGLLAPVLESGLGGLELRDLLGDGSQVTVEFFFQQVALLGTVALGLGRKLQPLEQRALVGEFLVEGALVAQLGEQALGHFAQLHCVQFAQGLFVDHHGPQCASPHRIRPLAHLRIATVTPSPGRFTPR